MFYPSIYLLINLSFIQSLSISISWASPGCDNNNLSCKTLFKQTICYICIFFLLAWKRRHDWCMANYFFKDVLLSLTVKKSRPYWFWGTENLYTTTSSCIRRRWQTNGRIFSLSSTPLSSNMFFFLSMTNQRPKRSTVSLR